MVVGISLPKLKCQLLSKVDGTAEDALTILTNAKRFVFDGGADRRKFEMQTEVIGETTLTGRHFRTPADVRITNLDETICHVAAGVSLQVKLLVAKSSGRLSMSDIETTLGPSLNGYMWTDVNFNSVSKAAHLNIKRNQSAVDGFDAKLSISSKGHGLPPIIDACRALTSQLASAQLISPSKWTAIPNLRVPSTNSVGFLRTCKLSAHRTPNLGTGRTN